MGGGILMDLYYEVNGYGYFVVFLIGGVDVWNWIFMVFFLVKYYKVVVCDGCGMGKLLIFLEDVNFVKDLLLLFDYLEIS